MPIQYTYHSNSTIQPKETTTFGERCFINTSARLYDPLIGRMLSPDNFACPDRTIVSVGMQDATSTQGFNRYVYVYNNPLKYKDPSGELVWIIPTIGWSEQGGLTLGITVGAGLPGVASIQFGVGYGFKQEGFYGFVGATAFFNTVYASFTESGDFSIGWSAGLSPFSGVPVSTNFLSVGVSYDVMNNQWSGNLSAWQIDNKGWHFNPSVNIMLFPERTTNFVRGQGFRTNDEVLYRFTINGQYDEALQYFGFEGKFSDEINNLNENLSPKYIAKTNPETGEITYTTLAFKSFDDLYAMYVKESYHSRKIFSGKKLSTCDDCPEQSKYYPEEAYGFKHAYKNMGLYKSTTINFINNANGYWSGAYGQNLINPNNYFNYFYRIPRLW